MTDFLSELAARRRFGMKPGLETIRALCAALGNPQRQVPALHIAGTNGKGAVAALLDACLRAAGLRVGRYTSPHLVTLNERFFLEGAPASDAVLAAAAEEIDRVLKAPENSALYESVTFFEALTAVAFRLFAREGVAVLVLETGLGGRLDATTICAPEVTVITRIGLDHCDWLGDTVEQIAAEKAGIIKPGVPVVLGRNEPSVRAVVAAAAARCGAPFFYAPELASDDEIPATFALGGSFNRENALTALAALKVFARVRGVALQASLAEGFARVVWPGRFQRVGRFLVDGAHNPPAARALAEALGDERVTLIAGFCGDKDVEETLRILRPKVNRAIAVRTNNPRSLAPEDLAAKMAAVGLPAEARPDLAAALREAVRQDDATVLICGSLFLAGEALVALGAYPWPQPRFDPSEQLKA